MDVNKLFEDASNCTFCNLGISVIKSTIPVVIIKWIMKVIKIIELLKNNKILLNFLMLILFSKIKILLREIE